MTRRTARLEMLSLLGAVLVVADAGGMVPGTRSEARPSETPASSWAQLTEDAASVERLDATLSRALDAAFAAPQVGSLSDARRARAGR
jgi:hypothetical protein